VGGHSFGSEVDTKGTSGITWFEKASADGKLDDGRISLIQAVACSERLAIFYKWASQESRATPLVR